jgi:hypothetical protein
MKKMKQIKSIIGLLIVVLIVTSCSTSDKVVSENFIQKRKYNKGFYVNTNEKKNRIKDSDNNKLSSEPNYLSETNKEIIDTQNQPENNVSNEVNHDLLIASTDDNFLPPEEKISFNSTNDDNSIRTKLEGKIEKSKDKLQKKLNKHVNKLSKSNLTNDGEPKTEGLGLAGFITGLVGLFIFGILFGLIAIIFGAISLGKINKNPDKFKGKGFAITSLILGIIDVAAFLILLALIV